MGRIGNIKDRKNKQDSRKAAVYTKMSRLIAVAVKEGGADLEYNAMLKAAIDKAKSSNMPNDNIERAIKKASGDNYGEQFENIVYEGYGPSGVAVIVEVLSDNRNRTAGEVRHIFDKNGGNLGTSGCVSYLFDRKGQLIIEKTPAVDEEILMMEAIEAGADDFIVESDAYVITTSPEDFMSVTKMMESKNLPLLDSRIIFIPQTMVTLDPENAIKMEKLIDLLEDNEDVQDVHHNWSQET